MRIAALELQNFRCFSTYQKQFAKPIIIIISGSNGSGKTSLLEAIHYACYLRSFRTPFARELIAQEKQAFFLKLRLEQETGEHDNVEIGFSGNQRLVKINGKKITSYKDLTQVVRIITITEDDLMLVKGGPEQRRAFLDSAVPLMNHEYLSLLRQHKIVVAQRNALLSTIHSQSSSLSASYEVWTEQLWQLSRSLAQERVAFIEQLNKKIASLAMLFPQDMQDTFELLYRQKNQSLYESWEHCLRSLPRLFEEERRMARSTWGAHLDDCLLFYKKKSLQRFASRGQQKLFVLLLKIAQCQLDGKSILLLDDFMTDLDERVLAILVHLLESLHIQILITTPVESELLSGYFRECTPFILSL